MSELRVFISSTFQDLQEEREHLVKKVFPEIRLLCRERGVIFTEVDLRWGVTDEQIALGQVIRICLEEVNRCRPYFICITGNRYGYVPTSIDIRKDSLLLEQYPWIRNAVRDGMSITEMEAFYALLDHPGPPPRKGEGWSGGARFYIRADADVPDDDSGELDRLAAFHERIRRASVPIEEYRDVESLGEMIARDLRTIINQNFANARPPTPLEEERARHEAFAISRCRAYIPDPIALQRLHDHVASVDPPLVVYAESGSGKSSLFAYWAEEYRHKHPEAQIIEHYVGIGATAIDHYAVIRHVCMEIKERFGRVEEIPTDGAMLEQALGVWIGYADHELRKCGESMVLIIDGLNQIHGDASGLKWIPDVVFPSIRMLISSTVEGTLLELRSRGWGEFGMQALTEEQRKAVVVRYLADYGKSLNLEQIKRIAQDWKCGRPLFLKTLLEELRVVGRHEEVERCIGEYLATTGTEDLFQRVLKRIEEDHGAGAVRAIMVAVWGSRSGLSEQELSQATLLSRLKVAAMVAGLEYHLLRKDGRLTFFHDYLRRGVRKRYLADSCHLRKMRDDLAAYFESQPLTGRTALELLSQYGPDDDEEPTPEQDQKLALTLARGDVLLTLAHGSAYFEVLARWTRLARRGCQAIDYYRRSTMSHDTPQGDIHGGWLSVAGSILWRLGHLDAAGDLFGELLTWARQNGRRGDEVEAHLGLGRILQARGESAASIPRFGESLRLATDLDDANGIAESQGNIVQALISLGRNTEAMENAERLLALCRQSGDRPRMAQVIGKIGSLREKEGRFAEALEDLKQQLLLYEETGDLRGASRASNDLGAVYAKMSRYSEAMECFDRMRALCDEIGDRRGICNAASNMGLVYTMLAQYDKAMDCYRQVLAIGERLGYRRSMREAIIGLGNVSLQQGHYADALTCYDRGLVLCRELDERGPEATALANMGIAHFHLGRYQQALDCHGQALAINDETGNRNAWLIATGNIGDVHSAQGHYDLALQEYATASAGHRDVGFRYGLTYWLAGTATVLLAISTLEKMPDYLPNHVPALHGDKGQIDAQWRALTLLAAQERIEECIELSDAISKQDTRFAARLLLARVEEARGEGDAAHCRLNDMLDDEITDQEKAEVHYWMWRLTRTKGRRSQSRQSDEHRREALRIYISLVEKTPHHLHTKRIEELQHTPDRSP